MFSFKYTALSNAGERVTGTLEAESEMSALEKIRDAYDAILSLEPISGAVSGSGLLSQDLGKTPLKALVIMCFQFSTILESGLPVARSIEMVAEETRNKGLRKILSTVSVDVEAGQSMADSFERHGVKKIPITFVETVRAGEDSGNLSDSFRSLYTHYDRQLKIRQQVRSLIVYPVFVFIVAIAVVIVMMLVVIPRFSTFFEYYGGELPAITKAMIGMTSFFKHNLLWILFVIVSLIAGYKIYGLTEKGGLNVGKLKLNLPVIGKLQSLKNAAQFASTMSIMIRSGLPITHAIQITAKVMPNLYIGDRVSRIVGRLEGGVSLSNALKQTGVMPNILMNMVTVGEKTGELKKSMSKIATYYEEEYTMAINRAVSLLSPIILVVTAAFAGFIVVSMYMSMFALYSVL